MSNPPQPAVPDMNGETVVNPSVIPPQRVGNDNGTIIPTQEVPVHSTQTNIIDPWFRQQLVQIAQFSWSTTQATGTVLWSVKINPKKIGHKQLNHIMQMYNTWGGSIEFVAYIAGTGFNGGKLVCVRIPPNISDDQIPTTIADLSVFPWTLLDPKMTMPSNFEMQDERNVMFHWTLSPEETQTGPSLWSEDAGTALIAVQMPLITSSTGNNNVNMSVFARVGPDFTVGQMIPISLSQDQQTSDYPLALGDTGSSFIRSMKHSQFYVSQQSTEAWRGVDGLVDFLGEPINSDAVPGPYVLPGNMVGASGTPTTTRNFIVGIDDTDTYITYLGTSARFAYNGAGDLSQNGGSATSEMGLVWDGTQLVATLPAAPSSNWAINTNLSGKAALDELYTPPDGPAISQPIGEVLIYFGYVGDTGTSLGELSTSAITTLCRDGYFKDLGLGRTPIYQVRDRSTRLPLFYVRLNPQGYFSTNMPNDILQYDLSSIEFVFDSISGAFEPLPKEQRTFSGLAYSKSISKDVDRRLTEMNSRFHEVISALESTAHTPDSSAAVRTLKSIFERRK